MKKEEGMLRLFFEEPTKYWHFEKIIKAAQISRPQAAYWLKKFTKDKTIKKIRTKGKMPYYIGNYEHPNYRIKKRLFAMNEMANSGFLQYLMELPKTCTVIIFGSFVRADWYKESDVDLFIYGNTDNLNLGHYEKKLHREIQVFTAQTKKDLKKFGPALIQNILKGYIVKGDLNFFEVRLYA